MSNFLIDEDTDLLAAEFVLGTLDSEERSGAHSLLKTDHGFIAMVRIWERRFGELHLMVEPVDPDAQLWQRIKSKVAGEAPATPAAEGEPPANQSPAEAAAPAAAPEPPKPAEGAVAEEAKPPETQASEAAPPPAEAAAEAAKSAEAPPTPSGLPPAPDLVVPPAVDIPPSPDPRALEAIVKSAPVANGAVPGPPPPLTPPFPKLVERPPEEALDRPNRQREFTIDVIRSRGRWRAFGMAMTVVLAALAGLVAAWKFVPDQLPAGLRPAELMMSIGVEAAPNAAPARKRAPLESGFDE